MGSGEHGFALKSDTEWLNSVAWGKRKEREKIWLLLYQPPHLDYESTRVKLSAHAVGQTKWKRKCGEWGKGQASKRKQGEGIDRDEVRHPGIPLSGGLVTIRAKEPGSRRRTRASCPKYGNPVGIQWESSVRDRASDRSMFRGVTNEDGGVARDRHLEPPVAGEKLEKSLMAQALVTDVLLPSSSIGQVGEPKEPS